jgi:hypothetical protein
MMIYKKMAAILADTNAIAKGKKNQAQGFMFRGIDDVMNELHETFAKHGVFVTTEVLESETKERTTAKGGLMLHVFQKIKFTFHAEDGSGVSSVTIGEAMDSGDKASNKCMSIALKYALLQAFLIPTEDMAEPDKEAHQLAANTPPKQGNQTGTAKKAEPELYTGTKAQKDILRKFFTDIGIKDADRNFMIAMSEECQRMPFAQIYDYIKPRAAKYLAEVDIPTESF